MTTSAGLFERSRYADRVLGCWTGKNIGGTLGAPFEGNPQMRKIDFYTQDLGGEPIPNDDLDLQLMFLEAVEEYGPTRLTPRKLGEFFLNYVVAGWNEYGIAACNMQYGFFPPVSGILGNDRWKFSNGAWIRSELWGCLFPGEPDLAATYAAMDACIDHCEEGIHAEVFFAALEAAAFVEERIDELIAIALARIPSESRIAQTVRLACDLYAKKVNFPDARNKILEHDSDLGFFQAPANLGFVILALLYGEGDFGRTVCLAVECGDDTDCTGATAGAILGLKLGRSRIPEKWSQPIGESIRVGTLNPMHNNITLPRTLQELSDRVMAAAERIAEESQTRIRPGKPIPENYAEMLRKAKKNNYLPKAELELPFGTGSIYLAWPETMEAESGKPMLLHLDASAMQINTNEAIECHLRLPENWHASPANFALRRNGGGINLTLTPGEFTAPVEYLLLELRLSGRKYPESVYLPIAQKNALHFECTSPGNHLARRNWLMQQRMPVQRSQA
ncbi:MAG: ADP-ribosylglycohydrolase family protein [Victivallaceae bacterium]|nr:ADP-ribosylglycohydrolase family protein [Victivallaceae bacterium]